MAQVQIAEAGKVVAFRPSAARTKRVSSDRSGEATILLFTGVRYERMEPAAMVAASGEAGAEPSRR
jgi:hypothetical protein